MIACTLIAGVAGTTAIIVFARFTIASRRDTLGPASENALVPRFRSPDVRAHQLAGVRITRRPDLTRD